MDRLIYTAFSAMRGAMARQTALANNLANASTTGFRADVTAATALWLDGSSTIDSRALADRAVVGAAMHAGSVTRTDRPLDIAINGDALMAVQAADGSEAYTRRGDLQLSASGLLTTGDGFIVIGQSGPITVPPHDALQIDGEGRISIVPPGGDAATPQALDRLRLATAQGSELVKGTDNLMRVPQGGVLPEAAGASVTVGALESSNVSLTSTLVDMVEASRSWEQQLRLISSLREMGEATSNLMQMPS